jgi:hypothetical protein
MIKPTNESSACLHGERRHMGQRCQFLAVVTFGLAAALCYWSAVRQSGSDDDFSDLDHPFSKEPLQCGISLRQGRRTKACDRTMPLTVGTSHICGQQ